jgi:hypothetical protein
MCFLRPIRNLGLTMEKEPIALATRLLVKAQGTTFDAESAALTAKAYRLLAEALNAHDDKAASAGTARKRERRQLRDRRSTSGSSPAGTPHRVAEPAPGPVRRSHWIHLPSKGHVDLRM